MSCFYLLCSYIHMYVVVCIMFVDIIKTNKKIKYTNLNQRPYKKITLIKNNVRYSGMVQYCTLVLEWRKSLYQSFYLFQIIGGWASIYIEMPLHAMDLKSLLLLLMSTKLVDPLCAMGVEGLMFTDNTRFHY